MHERPGVYSSYDASTVVSAGRAAKVIGVAAKAVKGTAGEVVTLTGYAAGVAAFGEDAADTPGMSTILRLLFANGASTVAAVRVAEAGAVKDYQDARILVCDSAEETVQQALRTAVEDASAARMERIAVVGGDGESAAELVTHAAALNSERMVLVGPDALDSGGKTLPGVFAAAALAGVIASGRDPGVPLNGAEIRGLGGLGTAYTDNDIDLLVRGGVTPLESTAGTVSPVRGITTRTTTGGAADTTWRELTTILIVDDVIPAVRQALRSKFARAKNTAQSRSAIRSQVIVELEKKVAEEIIDSYGEVTVTASEDDPTVCLVEFSFAVVQGYTARASKSSQSVEAFGESEPVATIEGQRKYTLELTRLYATEDAVTDGINFYDLRDFSLVICKPDRKVIYSSCQWSAIQEEGQLNAMVAEKVTVVASKRIETTA